MATNKHAQIRYQALDRCFANRGKRFFWEDLLEASNEALYDYTGKAKSISRRQLFEDIKYMESDQGWAIPLERHKDDKKVWYRYSDTDFSINKRPLNEDEADQLKEALLTLSRFKGMPQFQWVDELVARLESGFGLKQGANNIIEFEENPYLKGSEHITTLFHAILNKHVLGVTYQGFRQEEAAQQRIHPYYLKQYNNRWFLFGWDEHGARYTTMALDRIHAIAPAQGVYRENSDIDYAEYFEDVVGVSMTDEEPEVVELLVDLKIWPYLETKPLHGSQKKLETTDAYVRMQLEVKLNYELQAMLLSYGEGIQVLGPVRLLDALSARVKALAAHYGF